MLELGPPDAKPDKGLSRGSFDFSTFSKFLDCCRSFNCETLIDVSKYRWKACIYGTILKPSSELHV